MPLFGLPHWWRWHADVPLKAAGLTLRKGLGHNAGRDPGGSRHAGCRTAERPGEVPEPERCCSLQSARTSTSLRAVQPCPRVSAEPRPAPLCLPWSVRFSGLLWSLLRTLAHHRHTRACCTAAPLLGVSSEASPHPDDKMLTCLPLARAYPGPLVLLLVRIWT